MGNLKIITISIVKMNKPIKVLILNHFQSLSFNPLSCFPQGGNGHLPLWGKAGMGVIKTYNYHWSIK
jgi:hypothetical protein